MPPDTTALIRNARVLSPGRPMEPADVSIAGGRIKSVLPHQDNPVPATGSEFDANRHFLAPGFIDIHTHGAGGACAMDGPGALHRMAQHKLREGVTTFLPTTWTASPEDLVQAFQGVAAFIEDPSPLLPSTPAVHLEGPYLNPACAGAQNPDEMRSPDLDEFDRLAAMMPIAIVSVAAEIPGAMDFIAAMRERGVIPSLAHSAATYAQFLDAKQLGLRHLTHFCNQMTPLHHREIGLVGAGLLDDDVYFELIADQIHVCPDMLRLIDRTVSLSRVMLITDSISASWLPDGNHLEAGQEVVVKEGQCRLPNGALAGSALRFHEGLRHLHEITNRPLPSLIATTSWNQARSLGWTDRGRIEAGLRADLVLLDSRTLEPRQVWIEGRSTW